MRFVHLAACLWPFVVIGSAEPARAQDVRVYRVETAGVLGAPASLRLQAQRVLLDEGFGVSEIAACDCLLISDRSLLEGTGRSWVVQLRVYISRPTAATRATVTVEARVVEGRVWSPSAEAGLFRARAEAPQPIQSLLQRILEKVARATLPPPVGGDASALSTRHPQQ